MYFLFLLKHVWAKVKGRYISTYNRLKKYIDPTVNTWLVCNAPEWLSVYLDRIYLCRVFRQKFGYELDLEHPETFNEKLQWLKLYNRNPLYSELVDKYKAKEYVTKLIGKEYVIPLLRVYDKAEDIDFDDLPNQFVLKCNHYTGVFVVKDKSKIDKEEMIRQLSKQLNNSLYTYTREWPYRNVQPVIIAEKYMEDQYGELRDYKFFCFDGCVKAMAIQTGRLTQKSPYSNFFDSDFTPLHIQNLHPINPETPPLPLCKELMKELAEKLSAGIPFVRMDFYEVDGKIYFGEYTLYHAAGFLPFETEEWDKIFGDYIKLPKL